MIGLGKERISGFKIILQQKATFLQVVLALRSSPNISPLLGLGFGVLSFKLGPGGKGQGIRVWRKFVGLEKS